VLDDMGNLINIPQLAPSEAHQTLGVHLAPDGNNEDEFNYLLKVAKNWLTSMSAAKVTHVAVELSLCPVILHKIVYLLVATTLTLKQCNAIMSPVLAAGLLAAGITWTFPRAMVHSPWQWGGLNIPNLFTKQTIKHIHMALKYRGRLNDITGSLLQASSKAL